MPDVRVISHLSTIHFLCQGIATLKSAVESLTASVQQQELQHLAAADAQQRQLHAFNMALLEQAEELAALQALLGAPSRERQFSRRRVTEDLVDSLSSQVRCGRISHYALTSHSVLQSHLHDICMVGVLYMAQSLSRYLMQQAT